MSQFFTPLLYHKLLDLITTLCYFPYHRTPSMIIIQLLLPYLLTCMRIQQFTIWKRFDCILYCILLVFVYLLFGNIYCFILAPRIVPSQWEKLWSIFIVMVLEQRPWMHWTPQLILSWFLPIGKSFIFIYAS